MAQRQTPDLLDFLPAIFRETPCLGDFLRPFAEVLFGVTGQDGYPEGFAELLDRLDGLVDPERAPAELLPWLAGWVALDLDAEWDEARRRQYILEAMELYCWRGTVRGLTRFLEIYTGERPEIRECVWPAGMQIGVASAIGGMEPATAFREFSAERRPVETHDWYLVREAAGTTFYYRTDRVRQVEVDLAGQRVTVRYLPAGGDEVVARTHLQATVTRRDGLPDTRFQLAGTTVSGAPATAEYVGDTVLIGEEEAPYRFIVDVRVAPERLSAVKIEKVRAILELEKPAHTLYYLRLIPEPRPGERPGIIIQVRSTISIDALMG